MPIRVLETFSALLHTKERCMRIPLATLTLTLALSLAGMASADVYKCPTPGGKTVYQDAPCAATDEPAIIRKPLRDPGVQAGEEKRLAQRGQFLVCVSTFRVHRLQNNWYTLSRAEGTRVRGKTVGLWLCRHTSFLSEKASQYTGSSQRPYLEGVPLLK